jgi:hypothetical protein
MDGDEDGPVTCEDICAVAMAIAVLQFICLLISR